MRSRVLILCAVYAAVLFLVSPPAYGGRPREGDVLKIFNNQRVYVITNVDADAPQLADALLENCPVKERRVLTLTEWNALPKETRWFVTCVYLVDRERLAPSAQVPSDCAAEPSENWTQVMRTGRDWGVAYDVTLSAPDLSNLRRAIASFRNLKESPRRAVTETVRSLAVVTVGDGAEAAAQPVLAAAPRQSVRPPHLIPARDYESRQGRLSATDEIVLVDRSSATAAALPSAFAPVADRLTALSGDVIAWRESKPGGYVRAYVSAPTSGMLRAILRKSGDNLLALAVFEKPTVLATARDLRPVRRVAVASVGGARITDEDASRIAGVAASKLRELNSFEVLERTALTTVLAEIALDQAGLTRKANRVKVRQLAAADALLIVDLSRSEGGTEYVCSAKRVTSLLGSPPRRPREPSHLKSEIEVGGKDGGMVRVFAEGLLKGVVGTKTDEEYASAMRDYRRNVLPNWEREVAGYNARAESRAVEWRQTVTARSTARVAGSLRLVDLADGMVLWEVPIASNDSTERAHLTRAVYTTGELSAAPGAENMPGADGTIPGELLTRVAETAVTEALQSLAATALLPGTTAAAAPEEGLRGGKVIDRDGDSVLIGLGTSDGVRVGNTLTVRTSGGEAVRLVVTHVRPRTCDAGFAPGTKPALFGTVRAGDAAKPLPNP